MYTLKSSSWNAINFFSGLFVTTFATILGMAFGIIIGVSNRYVEEILLRFTDIFDSFPSIVIVLIVTSIFGGSAYSLGFALFLTSWTNYTRVSRNLTKELLTKEFIMISKLLDKKRYRIILEDLLPNVFPKVLIMASNSFAGVVLSLAGYSFLGFGVRAPYSELGMMVSEGKDYIYTRPEMIAVPGIIIFFMVICINIFGENIKKKYELKKE